MSKAATAPMMTNTELETIFNAMILNECSRLEQEFLLNHPELRLYLFLWFVRGWDAGNERFMSLLNQTVAEFSVGSGSQKGP